MLAFELAERNEVVILTLEGKLDALTAQDIRPIIEKLVSGKKTKVVINLASLNLIDSSGIGAIVSLFKRIRLIGGDVKITCLVDQPKEIFRILGLDKAFEIFESVEAAEAKLLNG